MVPRADSLISGRGDRATTVMENPRNTPGEPERGDPVISIPVPMPGQWMDTEQHFFCKDDGRG
jgi:hypothetical protein